MACETRPHRTMYDGVWIGNAVHPQEQTPFGFTCDHEMVPFIDAFYLIGFETTFSCQNTNESGGGGWYIPRRELGFTHSDSHRLLDLCLYLREVISGRGWNQDISIDSYYVPSTVFARITFCPEMDKEILEAVANFKEKK